MSEVRWNDLQVTKERFIQSQQTWSLFNLVGGRVFGASKYNFD